ncbi:MAG: DUF2933 domain-containing protein [Thermoleophilaceae bacterium]
MSRLLGMCFDWRVLGGLAVVGLVIWLYAPQLLGAALPLLFVLICPLSMVLMAWMMRGSMGAQGSQPSATDRLAALEQEQARLNAEVARARAELAPPARPAERAEG